MKIKVTIDGNTFVLKRRNELQNVDPDHECLFLFDDATIYVGRTDGKVCDDGVFIIRKPSVRHGLGLPFNRLIGWAYIN